MYMMKKGAQIDLNELGKVCLMWQTKDVPLMTKYYNYFKGKQLILSKQATDAGKPCNNVVVNYCSGIVENYTGYIVGQPVNYTSKNDIEPIQNVLNYNDVHAADTKYLRNCCIFGRAAEIMWIDEYSQIRFKPVDPREVIPIYDDTLSQELLYAVRLYKNDYIESNADEYIVEVYSDSNVMRFRSSAGFLSFDFIEEYPHYFGMVPFTFFDLNREQMSSFDRVMTLQDAYNTMVSSSIDDWEAFCDAYLVLKGVIADEDSLKQMKEYRCLMLDADSDASYLTKNTADQNIQYLLKLINDQIHVISASPDFNDEKFMSQSGIAMRYKLVGFENNATSIENAMRKALQRRIELICNILNMVGGDSIWRDVNIIFNRNLPVNETEISQMVTQLKGLVSDETLLSLLPFVDDAKEEYDKVQKQKQENFDVYRIGDENELLAKTNRKPSASDTE